MLLGMPGWGIIPCMLVGGIPPGCMTMLGIPPMCIPLGAAMPIGGMLPGMPGCICGMKPGCMPYGWW